MIELHSLFSGLLPSPLDRVPHLFLPPGGVHRRQEPYSRSLLGEDWSADRKRPLKRPREYINDKSCSESLLEGGGKIIKRGLLSKGKFSSPNIFFLLWL
jgi:hypothetical protein